MTQESLEQIFYKKAKELNAKGALFSATIKNLESMKNHDVDTYYHQLRVAMVAERLAALSGKTDVKPEFFGGANHDVGKLKVELSYLHEKHLSQEHYEEIKKHAEQGKESLEEFLFISTIAAAHHTLQTNSYGKTLEESLSGMEIGEGAKERLKEALVNVSIADFYDACHTRTTGLMWNGSHRDCTTITEVYPKHKERILALSNDSLIKELYAL